MTIQTKAIDAKLLRPGEEGYDEARPVDKPGRVVEIHPTEPSSGAVTTVQPDGSVLDGRAPGQAERLDPLPHLSVSLGGTLCAS